MEYGFDVSSQISYEAVVMEVYNAAALNKAPKIAAYEIEEDTYAADLADFALANSIYAALVEGHAAEVSRVHRVGQFDLSGGRL